MKENYHNLNNLKGGDKTALKTLCEKGETTATKTLIDGSFGIVVHNNLAYWKNKESILNYELQNLVICKKAVVPEKILNEKKKEKEEEKKKQKKEQEQKKAKNKAKKSADL